LKGRATTSAVAALVLVLGGCGTSKSSSVGAGTRPGKPTLTVSAAASLKAAFTAYAAHFSAAAVSYSFAGSDLLAAQIEQGVKPDVFAAANASIPVALYAKGLVAKPVRFTANKLVIAVPAHGSKVKRLSDLEKPGVTIAVGSATVPIGAYTRKVLAKLGPASSRKILANVRSEEPDVSGIVGKLTQGAVDAGFTYITDVKATRGALAAIAIPAALQPVVAYAAAVVLGDAHPAQARAFIAGLLRGSGRADLLRAGFLPPSAK
jgi:molybdate transport system substrate-binding protein